MTSCKHQLTVDQQVDALYEKMSQKERIAQLRSTYMDELFDAEGRLRWIPMYCVTALPPSRTG